MEKVKATDVRNLLVGDDTGLIKKVKMTFSINEDVISVPDKHKKRKNKRLASEALDDEEDKEQNDDFYEEEKPLIRDKPDVSFKLTNKSGS